MAASTSVKKILEVVSRIPRGQVASYGQVAARAGLPRRARLVGRALRGLAADSGVPWHRVVNGRGEISARGDALGHEDLQAQLLAREGVRLTGGRIALERYGWRPAGTPRPAPRVARGAAAGGAVRVKRVYAPPERADGRRVLVDRLWPRGIAKARARVAVWLKDVAPSDALRRWFGHDPARWAEFQRRYARELDESGAADALRELAADGPVTLLFGAKDEAHNNAVALRAHLARSRGRRTLRNGKPGG